MPEPSAARAPEELDTTERIRLYERALRSFFARRMRPGDVDDMVQEALARFLAARDARQMEYPAAYLFRIAGNLIADRKRREAVGGNVVDISDYQEAIAAPPQQEDARRLADLQQQLDRALAELPLRCRDVFVMRRFRNMTTPQIADALGISPRMVQKHLIRALAHVYIRLRD